MSRKKNTYINISIYILKFSFACKKLKTYLLTYLLSIFQHYGDTMKLISENYPKITSIRILYAIRYYFVIIQGRTLRTSNGRDWKLASELFFRLFIIISTFEW